MSFKRLRRALFGVAAAAAVCASAALAGCTIETSHPRAEITVEFNGVEYTMEYTLYRNMYPQTVRHFIELAEAEFYNDTVIHDYASNDWYAGGYAYNEEAYADAYENNAMDDYFNDEANYLEDNYLDLFNQDRLTASVYREEAYYVPEGNEIDKNLTLSTLYGEFESNGHTIENGQRSAELGSLKMYYNEKVITDKDGNDTSNEVQVFVRSDKGEGLLRNYQYNSATSLFAIQVASSSSLAATDYATFGYLSGDDDENTLNDLLDAIADYIDDNYNGDEDSFTTRVGVEVDRLEQVAQQATQDEFTATVEPIIIKSVRITRY